MGLCQMQAFAISCAMAPALRLATLLKKLGYNKPCIVPLVSAYDKSACHARQFEPCKQLPKRLRHNCAQMTVAPYAMSPLHQVAAQPSKSAQQHAVLSIRGIDVSIAASESRASVRSCMLMHANSTGKLKIIVRSPLLCSR